MTALLRQTRRRTRRHLFGLLGAAIGVSTLLAVALTAGALAFGGSSASITPFQVPLPIPPVLTPTSTDATTDYYTLTEQTGQQTIVPGTKTTIWGYNGITPGPTIVAQKGRNVAVHLVNNLPENMSLHLHGGHQPTTSDGLPNDMIAPGGTKDYFYPTSALSARTLWYHDHEMDLTAQHVYKGLAGFFLIKDTQEAALNLPSGNYDVPLVIQDRSLNSDGSLNYNDGTGNTVLVNGAPMPYFQVAARKYRFRLLNGSNETAYSLKLSNGQAMTQIGNEGGLLAAPVNRTSVPLSPAERADVVIDFSKVPVGTSVTMTDGGYGGSSYGGYSGGSYSWSSNGNIIRFDVVRPETDPSTVPATLRPITKLSASSASITRTFTLDRGRDGWQINGQLYDPTKYLATVKAGATEIWKFQNNSGDDHPIHVHLVNFQVLDVNGQKPAAPDDSWKDTINVPGRGSATVIAKFEDYTGTFVLHCHRLEHEDKAMMGQFQVVP